jgi:superfamily II DNA or RNA helicase
VDRFLAAGIDLSDMGVIQGDHGFHRPHAPIQIASVQTVARRGFPDSDFVIVDESHLAFEAIHRWMGEDAERIFIGLSATPWARGMGRHWDDLIVPTTVADLIAAGFLCPFRVFAPAHPDLSGIKTVAGDYHEGQLAERMSQPKLVADVVLTWLDKAERRPTLLFAVNRAHAALLHEQFEKAGVTSAYVDAYTPREERTALGKRFDAGGVEVICSVGTMGTGVDLDVRCVVNARPTKSEIRWVQDMGRGLRTAAGKEWLLVLDHSDTALRLGLPSEIHHTKLDSGKSPGAAEDPERLPPLPKECSSCGCLIPVAAKECPACGFVPRRGAGVRTIDGELVEFGAGDHRKGKPESATSLLQKMGRAEIFGQIKTLGLDRGWSSGRMAHCYRDIFGAWPNRQGNVPARRPSVELLSFVRSKSIAFAKSKNKIGKESMMEAARELSAEHP